MTTAIHPMLRDISGFFEEAALRELSQQCRREFLSDSQSCAEWRKMHAEWLETYFQKDRTEKPFEGASQDTIPILAEACDQFHARASKAMFPGHGRRILRCVPTGSDDPLARERAQRVEKHLQWQLMDSSPDYRLSKDALLLSMPLHGCVFTKAYVDPLTGSRVVRNVRATDLILPYGAGPRMIEDIPRKTELQWVPMHHARRMAQYGYLNNVPTPFKARGEVERNPQDDVIDEIMGFQPTQRDPSDYALLLEMHRFYDLDGDGAEEPYIVWLDAVSQTVVRVQIRYETDASGVPTRDKEAWEYYTQFNFVPNPDGVYGIGHGLKVGAINRALNRALRIQVDAALLAAVGGSTGIVSKNAAIKKGELTLKLGKFITTDQNVEDLRSQIMTMPFAGPNAAGMQLLQVLSDRADRLSMITETVTGSSTRVMQPTTVLALLEQSNIVFSAVYERLLMAWESELAKLYRLNRVFMNEVELYSVYDIGQAPTPEAASYMQDVARADYAENFQIKVLSDPDQLTLKERIAKAEAVYQMALANPVIQMSPVHLRNATARYLQALDVEDIDEILPTPEMVMQFMAMQQAAAAAPPA